MSNFNDKNAHLIQGEQSERFAENHLVELGYEVLDRNWSSRFGELDLVCLNKSELVFVEVRFRRNNIFGGALASVTKPKQKKLTLAAMQYIQNHSQHKKRIMRFDVIGLDEHYKLDWIKGAFSAAL